jgi:hypothetical protein
MPHFPLSYSDAGSIAAPTKCFLFTPTDANNILDGGSLEVLVRRVTTYTDGQITVTFKNGDVAAIPMINAVPRDMQVKKIAATGTTAQIVTDGVLCEV